MKKTQIMAGVVMLALSGSLLAQTIATVNGEKIDSSAVERRVQMLQASSQNQISDSPQLRQFVVNQLITEALVVQEARKLKLNQSEIYKQAENKLRQQAKTEGIDKDKNFKQMWAEQQNYLLMRAYDNHVVSSQPLNQADVKKEYDAFVARYQGSDEVQLGEIWTNDVAQAQAAIKDLNAKKSFADIQQKYNINEEVKAAGGVIPDYVPLPDLKASNENVYNAVAPLSKGQYTKMPIAFNDFQLILYVNDKRQFTPPAFDEVKPMIENSLRLEQISRAVDALGEKAKIEVLK